METVKIVYRFERITTQGAAEFTEKLYSVGALNCEPSGDGSVYVLVATFPKVNEYEAEATEKVTA